MRKFFILFVSLFLLSCPPVRTMYFNDDFLYNKNKLEYAINSTVALVFHQNKNEDPHIDTRGSKHKAYCAGVFIEQYKVLTAFHCIEKELFVNTPFGLFPAGSKNPLDTIVKISTREFYTEKGILDYRLFRVISFDKDNDLAVLEMLATEISQGSFYRTISPIRANNSLEVGDKVYAVGHPTSFPFVLTEGIVSHPKIFDEENIYTLTSLNVFFGNSGGPLFDEHGRIVGICSFIRGFQGFPVFYMSFFVHSLKINELLVE